MLAACLLAVTTPARGDEAVTARRLRKTGLGLFIVGGVHLGAGLALTLAMTGVGASCRDQPIPCGEGAGFLVIPAVGLLAVGVVLDAVAAPLFFVGRARARRLAQPALIPTPIGQLTPVPPRPQ